MLVFREHRKRLGTFSELYRVRSWYLFGVILVYRRYEQLTARFSHAVTSEMQG